MDFGWYIKQVLTEVKDGVDQFNREHQKTVRAEYPEIVEIEHNGVRVTVPFSAGTTNQIEDEA